MRRCSSGLAVVTLAGFLATFPAMAGWRNTEWGMSPEQVVKASHGEAHLTNGTEVTSQDPRPAVFGNYKTGNLEFDSAFSFDYKLGLDLVVLDLKDQANCSQVLLTLRALYGSAQNEANSGGDYFAHWTAASKNLYVSAFVFPPVGSFRGACKLTYAPLIQGGANGL
jgi:hypothetical protein